MEAEEVLKEELNNEMQNVIRDSIALIAGAKNATTSEIREMCNRIIELEEKMDSKIEKTEEKEDGLYVWKENK